MSARRADQLAQFLEAFLTLRNKTGPKGQQVYEAEMLVKRIQRAVERDNAGSPVPDGHRSSSGWDGGGGGPRILVDVAEGHTEAVTVTAVELAAIGRLNPPKDTYHEAVKELLEDVRMAVLAIDRIRGRLDRFDRIKAAVPDEADPGCWAMGRVGWEPAMHRTEIDGRFYELGSWAYKFTRRTNRLPTTDECRLHQQGKHVRVKIDGTAVEVG